jgi:hypothetical protein
VTLDGQPLANGVVNFQPIRQGQGDKPGPGSSGACDVGGRYVLETIHGEPGAVVGEHRVRIYSKKSDGPVVQDIDLKPQRELVSEKYNYRSELTFTVSAGGTDQANWELVSSE